MKFRKLVMCGIFAAATVMMSVPTAVSVSAAEAVTGEADVCESVDADSPSAEEDLQETTKENTNVAETDGVTGTLASSEAASEWTNRVLVVVEEDSSLNIRSGASTDAEIIGWLKRGAAADIVEKGEEWTKIVSGDVEGYVNNAYCLFEDEAEAQAEEICGMKATVTTDGLRIRREASDDSAILDVLEEGDSVSVVMAETENEEDQAETVTDDVAVTEAGSGEMQADGVAEVTDDAVAADASAEAVQAEANDEEGVEADAGADVNFEEDTQADVSSEEGAQTDVSSEEDTQTDASIEEDTQTDATSEEDAGTEWIQVEYNGKMAYVSAQYVDVVLDIGEAQSIEAVSTKQTAENAEIAEVSDSQDAGTSASADDVTLLAAIIQCEAGGECYEGQLAVGAVVMNRVKSGSYPNSISDVIYQSGQFSPASSGKLSRVLSSGNISSSCYQAANAAISGQDNTGGALHFHAGSGNGLVIGNQVFY